MKDTLFSALYISLNEYQLGLTNSTVQQNNVLLKQCPQVFSFNCNFGGTSAERFIILVSELSSFEEQGTVECYYIKYLARNIAISSHSGVILRKLEVFITVWNYLVIKKLKPILQRNDICYLVR